MSARQGQRLAPREAAISSAAEEILLVQIGRQAVGIPRPAAGKARVIPGAIGLAGKRSGLTVPGRQAAGRLVQEVALTRMRGSVVVFVFLLSAKQGVIGKGGTLWKDAAAIRVRGGVRLVDDAGFSLRYAHGLVVLFGHVLVAVQVPAQLAHVAVGEKRFRLKKNIGQEDVSHDLSSRSPIWC